MRKTRYAKQSWPNQSKENYIEWEPDTKAQVSTKIQTTTVARQATVPEHKDHGKAKPRCPYHDNMVLSLSWEHNKAKKGIAIHTRCSKGATVAWRYCDDNGPQAKYHQKTNSVCNKNNIAWTKYAESDPISCCREWPWRPGQKIAKMMREFPVQSKGSGVWIGSSQEGGMLLIDWRSGCHLPMSKPSHRRTLCQACLTTSFEERTINSTLC